MIYVDCDASYSYATGLAGIAYASTVLGNKRQVIRCGCATEAEMRAVLMAAEDHRGHRGLTLRTDSLAASKPHQGNDRSARRIQVVRQRVAEEMAQGTSWRLKWTRRDCNQQAHRLARSARFAAERLFAPSQ